MDLNLGNGHAETHLEFIRVLNVRIEERDPLKPVFDDLPFLAILKIKKIILNWLIMEYFTLN
ncbi:hypothetical protein [Methanobrevibacter arboriphilus]|uniref:hypothetical protein n=1 Tax=Methanobrevibacter arboriphilus TaxID=39441 RepID=UPI0006D0F478|nr:hypothetical protein [Methanobrevibacter arboriphilus]